MKFAVVDYGQVFLHVFIFLVYIRNYQLRPMIFVVIEGSLDYGSSFLIIKILLCTLPLFLFLFTIEIGKDLRIRYRARDNTINLIFFVRV